MTCSEVGTKGGLSQHCHMFKFSDNSFEVETKRGRIKLHNEFYNLCLRQMLLI